MDHELYPFSPIGERPAWHWPGGAALAMHVLVHVEHWELSPPSGAVKDQRFISEFGPFQPDYRTWTQREYGNRVGFFRVLEVLDRHRIRASVALGASACQRCPEIVETVTARGWEILGHGSHATRLISSAMSEEEERAAIASALDTIEQATGRRPTGWASQDQGESPRTPRLLAEAGVRYLVDWANDDQAYRMAPGLVSIPHQIEWDDVLMFWLRRIETHRYPDLVLEAARVLGEEGARSARNFGLSIHPWLFGMAHRIRYLDEALTRIGTLHGIWQATTGEIAEWAAEQLG
jgi:peptidoglycan/xylan/chitin deacetylase (PgdA/CDA1 family)